jgi:hypothetical protein
MASLAVGPSLCPASGETGTSRNGLTELRKPAPNGGARTYRERLQALIRMRYPQLLTEPAKGIPIITVLLNLYGEVVRSDLEISTSPPSQLAASEASFQRFGLAQLEMRYVGATSIETPANTVFVVFGGMGSRELDRTLVQRLFPQVFAQGLPVNAGIWILFDHDGRVLLTGQEPFEPDRLRGTLEQRYPGIETSDITVTAVVDQEGRPVRDVRGHPLQLTSVWLASGSPLPKG